MARKRDYAAEYARRQARARAKGFGGYYQQRIRGGAKAAPSAPRPTAAQLRRARGHASAADLLRELKTGSVVQIAETDRDSKGRLTRARIMVLDADGDERIYELKGAKLKQVDLDRLDARIQQKGGIVSPQYPLKGLRSTKRFTAAA